MVIYCNIKDGQFKNWHKRFDFDLILLYNIFIELIADDATSPTAKRSFYSDATAF
jgi:hypothetical protein